jgi:hypothetical protein
MSRSSVLTTTAGVLIAAGLSTWLITAEYRAPAPPGDYAARSLSDWPVSPDRAEALRDDAFRRAAVYPDSSTGPENGPFAAELVTCQFLRTEPSGTTAKFTCVIEGGEVIRVKYGRNAEIHSEALASRLISALGFGADRVSIVRRVRCYGCPRYPFLALQLLSLARAADILEPDGRNEGYTDFEWPAVERKFPAAPIETPTRKGWAWWELKRSEASRADLDALRLLAVFLAHWDNKSENQRLVCLDPLQAAPDQPCERPLLIIQDVGSAFGPHKVNLAQWRRSPIWHDRRACTVSMHDLPYEGATFPDAHISEAGREQLARALSRLARDTISQWITDARVPAFYTATDDDRDLDAWTAAFEHRIDQIVNAGPCGRG